MSRYAPIRRLLRSAGLCSFVLQSIGCGHQTIPNTDVEDTVENREVLEFVERYRRAVENRDVATLLKLASRKYYDDNGTPGGDDDLDYEALSKKLVQWHDSVLDARYDIRYRGITYEHDRILVRVTYRGSFRLSTPEGDKWARRLSDNRLVLVPNAEGGTDKYRIASGM